MDTKRLLLGFFCLCLGGFPARANFPSGEDNFLNSVLITTSNDVSDSFLPDTFSAEANEPSILGNAPQRSVWWRWIAPADGVLTLASIAPTINTPIAQDTVIGVFKGVALNSLTLVAANDDYPPGHLSQVTLPVTVGQEYRIKMDYVPGSDVGGMTLQLRFFQPGARTYSGVFGLGSAVTGQVFVTLRTTASGGYTGKATVAGKAYPFSGFAGAGKRILLGLAPAGLSPGLSLDIDLAAGTGPLPCLISDGTSALAGSLRPVAKFTPQSPSPVAGAYTARINMTPGFGYLAGKISSTGRASFAGRLGDGLPIILGGPITLASNGVYALPFLVRTFGGKGFFTGGLRFVDGGTDTIDNVGFTARAFRPALPGTFLPAGFFAACTLNGRAYAAPAAGQRALGFLDATTGAGKLTLTTVGGELTGFSENLTLSTANAFTFASPTRLPSLKLNPKTGLVSGSITAPTGIKRKISGVLTGIPGVAIYGFATGSTSTVPITVGP